LDTLASICDDVEEEPLDIVAVDISRFVKGGKTVVLQWKAPSVRQFYMIEPDAIRLMKMHPDWLSTQAIAVATIAVCHVAPAGGKSPRPLLRRYRSRRIRPSGSIWCSGSVRSFRTLWDARRDSSMRSCGSAVSISTGILRSFLTFPLSCSKNWSESMHANGSALHFNGRRNARHNRCRDHRR
jgi:hypothetical protein